jgi:hypothetical protein
MPKFIPWRFFFNWLAKQPVGTARMATVVVIQSSAVPSAEGTMKKISEEFIASLWVTLAVVAWLLGLWLLID